MIIIIVMKKAKHKRQVMDNIIFHHMLTNAHPMPPAVLILPAKYSIYVPGMMLYRMKTKGKLPSH